MSTIKTKNIQHPSATEPALVMNPDGTFNATMDDVVAQSLNGGTFSFRNKLINGTFDIWQRGSNFSVAGYTADRWYGDQTTAKTRVFGPQGQTYGMSLSGATTLVQSIELPLVGKAGEFYNGSTWVLSWYSTTDTFTPNVEFRDATVDAGGVAVTTGTPVAVETVGIWTRYKAEVTIDQDPLGTSECLSVLLASSGATSIAGVQFEKGGLTELEHRPLSADLALCQRYFQKMPILFLYPVAVNNPLVVSAHVVLRPSMRIGPTFNGTNTRANGVGFGNLTTDGFSIGATASQADASAYFQDITLDAEL